MRAEQEFTVIGVKDTGGNTWIDTLRTPMEMMHIDLNYNQFIGFAHELPEWCLRHGLQCTITKQVISVEFPDMTTE